MPSAKAPNHSKGLMCALRLLLLSLCFSLVLSEICNLCPDPSHYPQDESAKFSYTKNDEKLFVNCSHASDLALEGEFSSCDALHGNTSAICQCGPPNSGPFQCNLCSGNETLPFPDRVVAHKKCSEWQEIASDDFQMDCEAWQKSMGTYCGCNIAKPNYFDGFCRICNDTILPLVNETVTFVNGVVKYCAEIEQDINTLSHGLTPADCVQRQEKFSGPCECDYEISYTKSPSPGPPSSGCMRELSLVVKSFLAISVVAMMIDL